MNNPGFRPNKGRYLVLPTEVKGQETKIEGSQYSIEVAKDPHEKPAEGTIVAKGKDCEEFEVGAIVLFGKYSGYEQHLDETNYLILAETEILGERLVTPFDEPEPTLHEQIERLRSIPAKWKEREDPLGDLAKIRSGEEIDPIK